MQDYIPPFILAFTSGGQDATGVCQHHVSQNCVFVSSDVLAPSPEAYGDIPVIIPSSPTAEEVEPGELRPSAHSGTRTPAHIMS